MSRFRSFDDIEKNWVPSVRTALGDNLASVIGHSERFQFDKQMGFEVSVVLKDNSLEALLPLRPLLHSMRHGNLKVRYYFSQDYLSRTCDVFPVEYLTIKHNNVLLYGEDCFAELAFQRPLIRIEVERELRRLKLHLRHEFLQSVDVENHLSYLAYKSAAKHSPFFCALYFLLRDEAPTSPAEAVRFLVQHLHLGETLNRLYARDLPVKDKELAAFFVHYVEDLESIVTFVDGMVESL